MIVIITTKQKECTKRCIFKLKNLKSRHYSWFNSHFPRKYGWASSRFFLLHLFIFLRKRETFHVFFYTIPPSVAAPDYEIMHKVVWQHFSGVVDKCKINSRFFQDSEAQHTVIFIFHNIQK